MATLSSCRAELQSIINELNSIEDGIRTDFSGIGQNMCADCIGSATAKFQKVLNDLYNVDYNRLAEWILGEKEEA